MDASAFLPSLAALFAIGVLTVVTIRRRRSHSSNIRGYFVGSILAVTVLILSDLFLRLIPSKATALYVGRVEASACLIASVTLSLAALALKQKQRFGFQRDLWKPELFREPLVLVYTSFLFFILVLTWVPDSFQAKLLTSFVLGEMIYVPVFVPWYGISLFVFFSFLLAHPCYRLLSLIRADGAKEKAAETVRGLEVCLTGWGLFAFVAGTLMRSISGAVELGEAGYLISAFLFMALLYSYRETTIPKSLPQTYSAVHLEEGEIAVMLYTSAVDKMRAFSAFIREGLENGDKVDYTYPNDESETVRTTLKQYGINVEKYERNGALTLRSLTKYYLPNGNFDVKKAVKRGLDDRVQAKKKGYKHLREIDDLGDFSFLNGQWQKYLEYWDDPRWGALPGAGILYEPFLIELTVFNIASMREKQVANLVKAFCGKGRARLIDLIERTNAFSKSLGLDHKQLVGRKFLLEFDPVSDYEKTIRDFVAEATANMETTAVFTHKGSPIHSALSHEKFLKLFLLTQRVSVPTKGDSQTEMLLPADNSSLMLDALGKVLNTSAQGRMCLVFDSLSGLITSMGLKRTYKFLRYALEVLSSDKVTALFLLTSSAHDPKAISTLRGLFNDQLAYGEKRMQVVKLF